MRKKNADSITFQAQLWQRKEDYEGEITLVFKVPLSDAEEAKKIPVQQVLQHEIKPIK